MSRAVYHIGHTLDVVRSLPDASVDLVLTSPPFLALRSYLPADDPAKVHEIGQEANPAAFVDTLLELSAEWRRVLAPHGSIAIELGDTYSGSGGSGGDYCDAGLREGQARYNGSGKARGAKAGDPPSKRADVGWPLAKSLALVPELYRVGLAYGINPLTGQPSPAGRWRVRNVVRWHRPNPPVGALGDKYRPATTDMVVACVSDRRWFDLDAVRTPYDGEPPARPQNAALGKSLTKGNTMIEGKIMQSNPAGAPPLDTWIIPTEPFRGAHYATWPRALCVKPIESMCPRKVCTVCGQPSRRIVGEAEYVNSKTGKAATALHFRDGESVAGQGNSRCTDGLGDRAATRVAPTLGWTDCGHDAWRNGVVLDPFAGSGTTLAVATGCGRDAIGIDLDIRNADLARERIGMFMEIA